MEGEGAEIITASPACLFPSGKSYFAAFMLPQRFQE
jgi:hypothetical protein